MKDRSHKSITKIYCIECDCEVDAVLVSGRDVYPSRSDLYTRMFWKCPNCGNYVGTHRKTGIALGCIPNSKMKIIRRQIHAMMDPIWEHKLLTRAEVYAKLSEQLGYTYHTAELRSLNEANKVIDIIIKLKKEVQLTNELPIL